MQSIKNTHHQNAVEIITAILDSNRVKIPGVVPRDEPAIPSHPSQYQRHLHLRFAEIISTPSFDFMSKTSDSWLVVGDHRNEIAAKIEWIIERWGLGIGMLVLHAQQIRSGHIVTGKLTGMGQPVFTKPIASVSGIRGERAIWVPLRQYRTSLDHLASMNIAKPRPLWNPTAIVTHERDLDPCFYCSCRELNPSEVVVNVEAGRLGLSRNYTLGFTFAPFGNPLTSVHFLAWDRAARPLDMSRTPITVSDLVTLTHEINASIRNFFVPAGVTDFPVLDGLCNGWAGNTIFHQHFQFFQPDLPNPIENTERVARSILLQRDDVTVQRLDWPAPIFSVAANGYLNTGLVGNDLAGLWRYLSGTRKVPYKKRSGDMGLEALDHVAAHTHNLYVPGRGRGDLLYFILRDRERVDFIPHDNDWINRAANRRPQKKLNLGVLEATGTLMVENEASFEEMRRWTPEEISQQITGMISAVAPDENVVTSFERNVRELFPR